MACNSCNKQRNVAKQATRAALTSSPSRAATRSAAAMEATVDKMIWVQENSGNRGNHAIVGARSRRQYGRHAHGDRFQMLEVDATAQPLRYINVDTEMVQAAAPALPMLPTTQAPVPAQVRRSDPTPVAEDEFELDIAMLTLGQIKRLELDPETAKEALAAEKESRKRASVIEYLHTISK